MDDWIKFNMTTVAMKKIDDFGGIDNYLLALDEKEMEDANYIKKMRDIVASTMFYKGTLNPVISKRLGYLVEPPKTVEELRIIELAVRESQKCKSKKAGVKQKKPVDEGNAGPVVVL